MRSVCLPRHPAVAYLFLVRWLAPFVTDHVSPTTCQSHGIRESRIACLLLASFSGLPALCCRAFRGVLVHCVGVALPQIFQRSVGFTSCVLSPPPPNQPLQLTADRHESSLDFYETTYRF